MAKNGREHHAQNAYGGESKLFHEITPSACGDNEIGFFIFYINRADGSESGFRKKQKWKEDCSLQAGQQNKKTFSSEKVVISRWWSIGDSNP